MLFHSHARFADVGEPQLVKVPKPHGGTRLLTRLDARGSFAYRRVVAAVATRIESSLAPAVLAHRVADGRSLRLEAWTFARKRLVDQVRRRASQHRGAVVVADVRSCYASIDPRTVGGRLLALGCDAHDVAAVVRPLECLAERGVPGLPVGPNPSAVLANAVLSVADESLAAEGVSHVRWVDDMVVFVPDVRTGGRVLARVADALGRVGLELSETKTRLLEDRDEARAALARLAMSSTYLR